MKTGKVLFCSLVIAVIMALGLFAGALPSQVSAKSVSELQSQVNELSKRQKEIEKEIAKLEGKLSTNLDSMEKIVAQKNTIDQEIFLLYSQMANLNEQIAAYSRLIADKQDELDAAQERLDALNEKNKERIRAMEEDGGLNYWSVLFKANDFADLLDRLNMIEEIAASDQHRLEEMSEAAEEVANAKQEMEQKRGELEQTKATLEEAQKKQEKKREEADKLLADLVATGAEYQKLLDKAEEQAHKVGDKLDDAKDDLKDAKYQQWLSTSVPSKPGNGTSNTVGGKTWLTPCSYVYISSPFGWRNHPIDGVRRFHYGIDLAARMGTPIVASRSGTVKTAAYDSAGGYYVAIDHHDGFVSKYLHMTYYIVSPGQSVSAGQVIGYVGNSGASKGAHLHFAIQYNSEYVNPAKYIKV